MLSELKVNGSAVDNTTSYTFSNVTSNQTIEATFEVDGIRFVKTTATTFVSGARYIVCSGTNALTNNSGSVASTTVSPVNDTIITNDETIMWTIVTSGSINRLYNDATGTKYYLQGYVGSAPDLTTTLSSGHDVDYLEQGYFKIDDYYLNYDSGFTMSRGYENIDLYIEDGVVLETPTCSSKTDTEINIKVKGTLTSSSGNINYDLYVDGTKKATVTGTSGSYVTLTATGLSAGTTYNYYIVATSENDSSKTDTSDTISVTTYACGGNTTTCSGPRGAYCITCYNNIYTENYTPSSLGITSKNYGATSELATCLTCNATMVLQTYDHWVCSCGGLKFGRVSNNHIGYSFSGHASDCSSICSSCNGSLWYENALNLCRHAKTSSHKYCSHGYTEPHD